MLVIDNVKFGEMMVVSSVVKVLCVGGVDVYWLVVLRVVVVVGCVW